MNSLEIEIGDTVESSVGINKGAGGVCIDICFGGNGTYKISWDYYNAWVDFKDLTLIKKGKTMQFTKSDLIKLAQSNTVVVMQRNGNFKVVLGEAICGNDYSFGLIANYNRDMTITCNETHLDIVAVYKTNRSVSLNLYLEGTCLTLIWERTEQTEAQKKMELLQARAKALQEDTQAIQEQITKLQSKL
jgi:hypothetical protein